MRIDGKLKEKIKKQVVDKLKKGEEQILIIQTPYPLTKEELSEIHKKFPDLKEYSVQNEVREDLIGGFVLKHASKIIDASINSQINRVVEALIGTG